MKVPAHYLIGMILPLCILCGCSVNKFIPEGEYLLENVKIESDNKALKPSQVSPYLRQRPNSKWFSLVRIPMYIYGASGMDSTRWVNKMLRRLGDAPEIYSRGLAEESRSQMERSLHNMGYMGASVKLEEKTEKNRMNVKYSVSTGREYIVNSFSYDILDASVRDFVMGDTAQSVVKVGMRFDVNVLEQERQRITRNFLNRGYYRFNKDYITYKADTVQNTCKIDLTMVVEPAAYDEKGYAIPHKVYGINSVNYLLDVDYMNLVSGDIFHRMDSVCKGNLNLYYLKKPFLRPKVIMDNNRLSPGELYKADNVQNTYSSLGRLNILKFTNIRFAEKKVAEGDTAMLDAYVTLSPNKNQSMSFEIEGTNSAGDLGAAASVEYNHRNIFHGSETFFIRLRGAYEAVSGLEGYANTDYIEWGAESGLTFPGFMLPFLSNEFKKRTYAHSELTMKYNWQIRPEFERTLAAATWSYRWQTRKKSMHRLDLLDLNYIYMPYRSTSFDDYLKEMDEVNPLLRYSYEDLFILRTGYTYTYNSAGGSPMHTMHKSSYSFRFNVEESGNLLYGVMRLMKDKPKRDDAYQLANIDFAQYVKFDVDYARNWVVDDRNAIVFHAGIGVAYPYGNSRSLPFEKLYFSGGANSVRGWSVRSLGPGGYRGDDNRLDYVNHTGDMKIDLNLEYRTHLFWKLNGAFYIDAGNIWNIRYRESQPEGQFRIKDFYKQFALSYGLGIRFDFDFLILRFDSAMKAINPMRTGKEQFPLISPVFDRDFAFHFAVGYPF